MPSPSFNGLGKQIHTLFRDEQSAVFKPQVGSSQSIDIIFNDRHQEIDRDGKPYGAPRPVAWVLAELGLNPKFDDRLEIDGSDYLIKEIKGDGLEMIELVLVEL